MGKGRHSRDGRQMWDIAVKKQVWEVGPGCWKSQREITGSHEVQEESRDYTIIGVRDWGLGGILAQEESYILRVRSWMMEDLYSMASISNGYYRGKAP